MATLADLIALKPASLPRYDGTLAEAMLNGWSGKGTPLPPEYSDWRPALPGKRGLSDMLAAMLPLEQNSAGERRLGVPGAVQALPQMPQAIADMIQRSVTGDYQPSVEDPTTGRMYDPRQYEDAMNLAALVSTGGMPMPRPAGSLGMFGGVMAKTADKVALQTAKDMAAKGATRESIWAKTGWFQGKDGKWRFEIDDSKSFYRALPTPDRPPGDTVGRQVIHDELFSAYPELRDIGLMQTRDRAPGGTRGSFSADLDNPSDMAAAQINLFGPDKSSTVLHELQHGVETLEGFAPGGNPTSVLTHSDKAVRDAANAELQRLLSIEPFDEWARKHASVYKGVPLEEVRRQYEDVAKDLAKARRDVYHPLSKAAQETAFQNIYRRMAGEVEARNVQTRMGMSREARKATPPWLTEDIDAALQIILSRQ